MSLLSAFRRHVDKSKDKYRTIRELVESRGFDLEVHQVTTIDGYVLELHRIRNPFRNETSNPRPVLLQHGMASNSSHWLIADSESRLSKTGTLSKSPGQVRSVF